VKGRIRHMVLSRVSPLAVPVLLEIGRESVRSGESDESLLAEAEALVAEATGEAEPPPFHPRARLVHRANFTRKPRQRQGSLFG
jgi:ATP-dependent helicase Lhr and Lhr-like helicase